MKIGIATLFAPSNYGNALQMLSLQRYLSGHGYDVEILRHWISPRCEELRYYHNRINTFKGFLRFVIDVLSFGGAWSNCRRETKMFRWINRYYRLSPLCGSDGEFPIEKLKYDCIVAGSDQIWNPKYRWPDFNLLGSIPAEITKIAYAASFGTDDRTLFDRKRYALPLSQFKAVSMREESGRKIVEELFGVKADLVCDPTLLHTKNEWENILGLPSETKIKNQYVVYLVTPDFRSKWRMLIRLAKETDCPIHFFAFSSYSAPGVSIKHPLRAMIATIKNLLKIVILRIYNVHMHMTATPTEFVKTFAQSKGLFTDSFHGMMFATIFNKHCNMSVGTNPDRLLMSARLRDFVRCFGDSEMLTSEFCYSGLRQAKITPELKRLIEFSKKWLEVALA